MTGNMLVFYDSTTDIDILVDQVSKNPPRLDARDVEVVRAAKAAEGEVWSPRLLPYQDWSTRVEVDGCGEGADRGGVDGDLLVVGALGMGLADDERERLLARAAEQRRGDAAAASPGRMDGGLRGALRVRQDEDGYALVGVDLHRLAQAAGRDDGLVVRLPAFVDGVPVVRVTAEAFARRLVQGVGVRVLAVPDTVESVGAGAFLALSAQRIHLGRGVRVLGEQPCDLAGVSPRLARRTYSVDVRNPRFSARAGSLFADGGAELLFLASPYAAHAALPDGVERVGAAAFAAGCEPPSVVDVPTMLARVDSKAWDDAVWRCPQRTAAHRALAKRDVRLAGPRAVEHDGCWYDFDDEGAVLVAGPPAPTSVSKRFAVEAAVRAAAVRGQGAEDDGSPAHADGASSAGTASQPASAPKDALVLPREVEGRPLVRIGVRALPFAPETLVVPDTVRVIERDNACRGTKRLVLPEGLRSIGAHCFWSRTLEGPVPIPASVRAVGEGGFEYAVCRLEHTGSVVHVSADQLLSCFVGEPLDAASSGGGEGAVANNRPDAAAAHPAFGGEEGATPEEKASVWEDASLLVPFDFEHYDELLRSGKNLPDRLGAVLHRLAVPYRLTSETQAALVGYLREHEREAQERVAREGDRALVETLVDAGFIDERTFDRQIELLRAANRTDCVIYLMEEHRKRTASSSREGGAPSARERFAL